MNGGLIDRQVAREAAQWFTRLHDESASAAERAACEQWRAQHQDHERAWQLAQRFSAQVQRIPARVGMPALDRGLSRRDSLKVLTLLIMAAPVGLAAYRTLPWQTWSADIRTAIGEQREVQLADGTRIQLNTDSAISVTFSDNQRRVQLRAGEVLISTGKDPAARPFFLDTAQGSVRPIGTRFIVRQQDQWSQVAVLEGAVEISPRLAPASSLVLNANQQASFDERAVLGSRPLESRASDWTQGVIRAEKMRLGDFVAELGRYRAGLLRCDPALADLLISGAFQLRNTDQALAALTQVLPVQILYRTRYWVTVAPLTA